METNMWYKDKHLKDLWDKREKEAIRRIINKPDFSSPFVTNLLKLNSDSMPLFWCLLWQDTQRLIKDKTIHKPGDIDIILGKFDIINDSGNDYAIIKTDILIGIEVKVEVDRKSVKNRDEDQEQINQQISGLLNIGFNKVVLLNIIATEPQNGNGFEAWLNAAENSNIALRESEKVLMNMKILLKNDPIFNYVGHWVAPWGSIDNKNEYFAGSVKLIEHNHALNNPLLYSNDKVQKRRKIIEEYINKNLPIKIPMIKIRELFGMPTTCIIYTYCEKCNKIHLGYETCHTIC